MPQWRSGMPNLELAIGWLRRIEGQISLNFLGRGSPIESIDSSFSRPLRQYFLGSAQPSIRASLSILGRFAPSTRALPSTSNIERFVSSTLALPSISEWKYGFGPQKINSWIRQWEMKIDYRLIERWIKIIIIKRLGYLQFYIVYRNKLTEPIPQTLHLSTTLLCASISNFVRFAPLNRVSPEIASTSSWENSQKEITQCVI